MASRAGMASRLPRSPAPVALLLLGTLLLSLAGGDSRAQPVELLWPPPLPEPQPELRPGAPPPPPPPAPGAGDRALEAAILQRLFAGPVAQPPLPQADPEATEWEQARALAKHPPCAEVGPLRYVPRRADLDGDGRPELLAVVVGSYVCGSRGCTLLIFRESVSGPEGGLELIGELGMFQTPLRLASRSSFGWQDLALPADYDASGPGWYVLRSDGRRYPLSPEQPSLEPVGPGDLGDALVEVPAVPFEEIGLPLTCPP